ncbi:isochorismatase family protein [Streptacidiphilus sp. N1-12]|uniref:Isochorismatase family protein n=1 Tax=Streptacidiphilus alkalitolerans TaxID=3342712 RepID=A0ABV6WR58_9ACTN
MSDPWRKQMEQDSTEVRPRLHAWRIAEREYERMEARRGRRHAYTSLTPARTALVVVDMVRFFVDGDPYGLGIVPQIQALAAGMRQAGGLVVWVLPVAPERANAWGTEFYGEQTVELLRTSGGAGAVADRLWPELVVQEEDLVVEKRGTSALFPGNSTLPQLLEARGIDTVVVGGKVSGVCVESTVRDAAALGYRAVLVADAAATYCDEAHNHTLTVVYRSFGDVRTAEEVLTLLEEAGQP